MDKTNEKINYKTALETLQPEPFKFIPEVKEIQQIFGYGAALRGILAYIEEVTQFTPEKRFIDSVPLLDKLAASSVEISRLMTGYQNTLNQKEPPYKMPINGEVQADIETAIATGRFDEFYKKGEL